MLQATNVKVQFGKRVLFDDFNMKFTKGNCYGIIGANGSGKSTLLHVLSGEIEPTKGQVSLDKKARMSILNQNQNDFDEYTALDTVLRGHKKLYAIMVEKDAIYNKADFDDKDGIRAGELESEFAELGGWEAEPEARMLLNSIGIKEEHHEMLMKDIDPKEKVKILIAQALFGNPDVLILDEPTNNLDAKTIVWLENFLLDFENLVLIVSHNRHFLNKVCTNICDIDYNKINVFVGNYDFWYESNQLLLKQAKEANKKAETRAAELKEFIARFSANASKSRQATSRKKELEKLTIADIKPSSRKYPFIDFKYEKEPGNEILFVENLTKEGFFKNLSFTVRKDHKIGFLAQNALSISMLFDILMGKTEADSGTFRWGNTITPAYVPQDNRSFFEGCHLSLVDWLKQFSKEQDITFIRGWLGRMLFSGEEALKEASVLSGGEKMRCMMAKAMLTGGNFLIMDEPTNHLDLESITALNKGMINFKGSMLFASHDFEVMQTVANRIIEISENKIIDKETTYQEYLDLQE